MTRLSREQVLKENQTRDPSTITSLTLTHKALSDVSCLSDFKNLERLDLSFNNLTSLEGLKACVNLKWLSVVQNKLQSLKGVEGLPKLAVLNAGKNKLRSLDEVRSLVALRALILNDNEIVSMCELDQMKELNTLVLSRNPIREIRESLLKIKSITKLSLSHCQVEIVGFSLKSCTELKELRLAHNDIKTLPAELAYNKKLQNLDLGNNLITRWSDMKVLNSLVSLKNLNLQGNPIAEDDKLARKIKKILPNLHIFNARPIDKHMKKEKGDVADKVTDSSYTAAKKLKLREEERRDLINEADFKGNELQRKKNESSDKLKKEGIQCSKDDSSVEKKLEKKSKKKRREIDDEKHSKHPVKSENEGGHLNGSIDVNMDKESKRKRKKITDGLSNEISDDLNDERAEKKQKKRSRWEQGDLDGIDDGETSFAELFSSNAENPSFDSENKIADRAFLLNSVDGLVSSSSKKRKTKNKGMAPRLQLSEEVEVGLGGPSTWGGDDE